MLIICKTCGASYAAKPDAVTGKVKPCPKCGGEGKGKEGKKG